MFAYVNGFGRVSYRRLSLLCIAAAILVGNCSVVEAADPDAMKLLSQGIHQYFEGLYPEAIANLNQAAPDAAADPRIYYFRGLARMKLGQTEQAREDFQRGAMLEARRQRQGIGYALQRVQGSERLTLERYRRQQRHRYARLEAQRPPASAQTDDSTADGTTPQSIQPPRRAEIPPAFRELPPDPNDPFGADAAARLGRGEQQAVTEETPAVASDNAATAESDADAFGDEPFGSGVEEPFGSAPTDPVAADSGSASSGGGNPLGAAFRALTRGMIPGQAMDDPNAVRQRLEQAVPGMQRQAPSGDANDPFAQDDPFAEDGDPFGADPFAEDNSDDASPPSDPFADDPEETPQDVDDPFAGDDPFAEPGDSSEDLEDPFGGEDPFGQDDPFAEDSEDPFGP